MKIIDGKALALKLREEIKANVEKMKNKPGLAVVIVGDDGASQIYVRNKIKACQELGIRSYAFELPENFYASGSRGAFGSFRARSGGGWYIIAASFA